MGKPHNQRNLRELPHHYLYLHFTPDAISDIAAELVRMKFALDIGEADEFFIHSERLKKIAQQICKDSVQLG